MIAVSDRHHCRCEPAVYSKGRNSETCEEVNEALSRCGEEMRGQKWAKLGEGSQNYLSRQQPTLATWLSAPYREVLQEQIARLRLEILSIPLRIGKEKEYSWQMTRRHT